MNGIVFYPAGNSPAISVALQRLEELGCRITDIPDSSVTHLLLPVPSFDLEGALQDGGELGDILATLPDDICVIGGNLRHPLLEGYETLDLLQDDVYLAQNAAITADCSVKFARDNLPVVLSGCPVLVLGWGRIGKCLAQMLKDAGAEVTVAARKPADLAILQALGYRAENIHSLNRCLMQYRLIMNTIPSAILTAERLSHCQPDCIKIELASRPGLIGKDVLPALGLPAKFAPESSGHLIARSILRLLSERRG